jgi:hypothetical protein
MAKRILSEDNFLAISPLSGSGIFGRFFVAEKLYESPGGIRNRVTLLVPPPTRQAGWGVPHIAKAHS